MFLLVHIQLYLWEYFTVFRSVYFETILVPYSSHASLCTFLPEFNRFLGRKANLKGVRESGLSFPLRQSWNKPKPCRSAKGQTENFLAATCAAFQWPGTFTNEDLLSHKGRVKTVLAAFLSVDRPWHLDGYKMRFDSSQWFPHDSLDPKPVQVRVSLPRSSHELHQLELMSCTFVSLTGLERQDVPWHCN